MAQRLTVDLDKCIKAGECYYNHPELFKVRKDGFPSVLNEHPGDARLVEEAEGAIAVCPAQAIKWVDA
ncbi:MAG: ferredoxin [Dehalococcoidia bacterium]